MRLMYKHVVVARRALATPFGTCFSGGMVQLFDRGESFWIIDKLHYNARVAFSVFDLCDVVDPWFEQDRKEELRELIESGGGQYMGAMEARTTTHLVAEVSASFFCKR